MTQHTIYIDDMADALTLASGDDVVWPDIELELDVKWYPAEPDVGIFTSTPEIVSVSYMLDSTRFADEAAFVQALYERVGDWYEEGPDTFTELIANRIDNEELEAE